MSFSRAVGFLWLASWRNRLLRQLARLKRPRYLLGALVGLAYLYSLVGWRLDFGAPARAVPPGVRLFAELSLVGSVLGTVFSAWVLGPNHPSLTFSEAEVVQLFPAPVTRRALLHYKLARGLLGATLGALFATLFIGRVVGGRPVLFFVGASLALGTLYLHATAASFTRTRLAAWGVWGSALRWGGVGLALAVVTVAMLSALREHPFPATFEASRELRAWLEALVESPGARAVLWPGRVLVAPAMARDVGGFLRALPPVLLLVVAHYVWVLLAEVPFEDAAVARVESRTRARALRAPRSAERVGRISLRKAPFRLVARGRPEVALVWKNLIARKRLSGGAGTILMFMVLGLAITVALKDRQMFSNLERLVGSSAVVFAIVLTMVGPSAYRMDLRMDLPKLDLLRALPLTGRQVVGAELVASALTIAMFQLALLAVSAVVGPGLEGMEPGSDAEWLTEGWRPGCAALALVLPSLSLAVLFVQNAAVVLFPAWTPADVVERARGLEALGQRLLTLVGSLVVTLLGLIPASVVAVLVGVPLFGVLGPWALTVAGAAAAAVLVGEVALGVMALGHAFERLDVSEDRPE